MPPRRTKPGIQNLGQLSAPENDGNISHGTEKVQPRRKSARIENIKRRREQAIFESTNALRVKENLSEPLKAENRKRTRPQESKSPIRKRPQTSPFIGGGSGQETARNVDKSSINPIDYWRRESRWPRWYYKQDNQTRGINKEFEDAQYESHETIEANMNRLLARKRSLSSPQGKQSEASSTTPIDQNAREAKSITYARPSYVTALASKGSFMRKFDFGVTNACKTLCRTLLETEQSVPSDTLFRDDLFEETCESVQERNEAMIVRDISPLICPSAQVLRIYGAKHLGCLNESVNECWNSAITFCGPRPQPDYSVGFGRSAFTDNQLKKLRPFVGDVTDTVTSYFMGTWQMYFPFLTCEVKCGTAALNIADRQNAHSATIAQRGIVELFRLAKREIELNQEIIAFSISHDHRTVRIYGHYPIIEGNKTSFYRHSIHEFTFAALDGKEKWTAYKFIKNVYNIWMPTHFERICSAIDALPIDSYFEVSEHSQLGESELLQGLASHSLSHQSSHDAATLLEEADGQPSRDPSRGFERAIKKPRKHDRIEE